MNYQNSRKVPKVNTLTHKKTLGTGVINSPMLPPSLLGYKETFIEVYEILKEHRLSELNIWLCLPQKQLSQIDRQSLVNRFLCMGRELSFSFGGTFDK